MALERINGVNQSSIYAVQSASAQGATKSDLIFNFTEGNSEKTEDKVSDAKIMTKNFKKSIMSKIDAPKDEKERAKVEYYLGLLIETAQILNGLTKNKIKPQGTEEQNKVYNRRIRKRIEQMKDYAEQIPGLSLVQDSVKGLYKLCIDNKLYNIPERKVEIIECNTDFMTEFLPKIVD